MDSIFFYTSLFIGYVLGVVSATDPDRGSNAIVTYTLITDPNDNGLFAIDSVTVCCYCSCALYFYCPHLCLLGHSNYIISIGS